MINTTTLVGWLTHDPELRVTGNDIKVTTFSIAVEHYVGPNKPKQVYFFDVTAWRQNAEYVTRYFRKGSQIVVQGFLANDDYTTAGGEKRKKVVIVADSVEGFGNIKKQEKKADADSQQGPEETFVPEAEADPEINDEELVGMEGMPF